jgi:hypothetical protein
MLSDATTNLYKFSIRYHLRISIPESDPEKIIKITESIEDPYEKALNYVSWALAHSLSINWTRSVNKNLTKEELQDDMLAISDTVGKMV